MSNDYIVFILSHGRANNVITYDTLRRQGYTGRIGIVIDNEDKQAAQYKKKFGEENVFIFDKAAVAETFEEVHKADRRTVVYARNACFDIAKKIGVKYFIELDDDYTYFAFDFTDEMKYLSRTGNIKNLDKIFEIILNYYKHTPQIASIALAQGGDFIGGANGDKMKSCRLLRKAMNSFFCSTDRPFKFTGRINEDVNTYTMEAQRGVLFFTTNQVSLNQKETQQNAGGMTDVYLDGGTYLKSFFSVICCPSAVKVGLMNSTHKRLHHSICWENVTPKILAEMYKKQ